MSATTPRPLTYNPRGDGTPFDQFVRQLSRAARSVSKISLDQPCPTCGAAVGIRCHDIRILSARIPVERNHQARRELIAKEVAHG